MNKRIEIILKGDYAYDPDILQEIQKGNFTVEIVFHPPIPITTAREDFGAVREGKTTIIGYRRNPEPPSIFLTLTDRVKSKTYFCIRSDTRQIFDAVSKIPSDKYLKGHSDLYGCEIRVIEGTHVKVYPPEEGERTYEIVDNGLGIKCLACGMISYNSNDVANLYCGNCHKFHAEHTEGEDKTGKALP